MPSASSLILRYRKANGPWQSIPVWEGNLLIGRSSACNLRLPGRRISRKHAELRRRGNQVWIVDLGSSNGTEVNGKRLHGHTPQQLKSGQKIKIGDYSLTLGVSKATPSRKRTPGHIFISYSRQDSSVVYPLADKLKRCGFNIWIDRQDIRPGRPWRGEIVRGIETADTFILLLSPYSAASDNVRKELDLAIDADVTVIPVIVQPVKIPTGLKYQLVDLQYIDLFKNPEYGFSQLSNSILERQEYLALQPERVLPDRLQAELLIPQENIAEYIAEKQQRLINFLAQVTRISPTEISIASLAAGSVRVIVSMPAAAAYELKAQALNGNPALLEAGISSLRLVGDPKFIQVAGGGPPGVGRPGEPPGPSTPPTAPFAGGLKILLITLGALAAIVTGIILLSNNEVIPPLASRTPTVTETSTPTVMREIVTPSPTSTTVPTSPTPTVVIRSPTSTQTSTQTVTPTTPTVTLSPTSTRTHTPTYTPTETEYVCAPILTVKMSAFCREGPSKVYDIVNSFSAGESFDINGQNEDKSIKWWWIQPPHRPCWISNITVATEGDLNCLPVITAPPTPTPTYTPSPTPDISPPPAPSLISPSHDQCFACSGSTLNIDFEWSKVSDPSGISHYEWSLDKMMGILTEIDSGSTSSTSISRQLDCPSSSDVTYRWRVRAVDGAGNKSQYSDRFFTITSSYCP